MSETAGIRTERPTHPALLDLIAALGDLHRANPHDPYPELSENIHRAIARVDSLIPRLPERDRDA